MPRVWRSPDDLMDGAKEMMLQGREPETRVQWALVVNFWAVNISPEVQPNAVLLMCKLYDCPLDEEDVNYICEKQKEVGNGD